MARPLRIEYPGALYHVTARGNRKQDIFLDDADRRLFYSEFATVVKMRNWLCHAYCLMDNHYHLLIETPEANLSDGMRDLNSAYSQAFNRRHNLVGHAFQGRFKAFLIEKEPYFLEVARYIVLNPVRAGMEDDPGEWVWSSYAGTVGLTRPELFLCTDWLLGTFSKTRQVAQEAYRAFVLAGKGEDSPLKGARHNIVGSPQFIGQTWHRIKDEILSEAITREDRLVGRLSLEEIFQDVIEKEERNEAICLARRLCGYSVSEIARHLGLSAATVSIISRDKTKH